MNILLILHITGALTCIVLVPVLYYKARKNQLSFIPRVSVLSALTLTITGLLLSIQNSITTLPAFCLQASSLFVLMYVSYRLGMNRQTKMQTEL